ncbi:MAG: SUMF1/EgtB/PvdO family nonheme iron enzyme [Anaerolineales bacterium]|jgi:formylglycine-generating enzyme required for sulfatase activity
MKGNPVQVGIIAALAAALVWSGLFLHACSSSSALQVEVGDTLVSDVDGMMMVFVPAGEFLQGAGEDPAATQDEFPQRSVYLDAYWIDQTEVTNAMFAEFLNQEGNQKEGGFYWADALSSFQDIRWVDGEWVVPPGLEQHPVREVTWFGAQAYCQWVGRRLPTEAEWEKAARGTDGRVYPWGESQPNCDTANYDAGCYLRVTTRVGSWPLSHSPYGVHDMAGNLWEWTADWYQHDYYASAPLENPQGPGSGTEKVIRGGSYFPHDYADHIRTTNREGYMPTSSGPNLGFRCAADAQQ